MISGLIFLGISLVLFILFVVWVIRAILSKIYKKTFGKGNVVAIILFPIFSGITFLIGCGILTVWLATGGFSELTEKVSYITAVNLETAKKGWTKGLLKKMDTLSFSIEKIAQVESDYENNFKKDWSSDKFKTFEAYLVVENPSSVPTIRYKDLRKSNIAYAEDENGAFIPAMIVNHSEFDEIPWILKWFLPNYRVEQKTEFIPGGKSYLNVRFDIPEGHQIKKICLAEKKFDIDESKIQLIELTPNKNAEERELERKEKGLEDNVTVNVYVDEKK